MRSAVDFLTDPPLPPVAPPELPVDDEVSLVRLSRDDANEVYRLVDGDRQHLARFELWALGYTLKDAQDSFVNYEETVGSGLEASYKVMRRGEFVGLTYLFRTGTEEARLGYWLIQSAEGQGVMARATRRLRDYGFKEWGLDSIYLEIMSDNVRSQALARRLGARLQSSGHCGRWEINKNE
jgi:ribosomal-protein-serine acetyltransferase